MMTEKQAMGLVYYNLGKVSLVARTGNKNIFSSGGGYMVAIINNNSSIVSSIFNTLEEAQAW